jgi:hypothetical protein
MHILFFQKSPPESPPAQRTNKNYELIKRTLNRTTQVLQEAAGGIYAMRVRE